MFVESFAVYDGPGLRFKKVNKEAKFWARNGRFNKVAKMMFFDVKINRKFYFFSYHENSGDFLCTTGDGVIKIGSRVPRVYYTVDGLQFCVTAGRLWVKQL